jgi:hypothetical protein
MPRLSALPARACPVPSARRLRHAAGTLHFGVTRRGLADCRPADRRDSQANLSRGYALVNQTSCAGLGVLHRPGVVRPADALRAGAGAGQDVPRRRAETHSCAARLPSTPPPKSASWRGLQDPSAPERAAVPGRTRHRAVPRRYPACPHRSGVRRPAHATGSIRLRPPSSVTICPVMKLARIRGEELTVCTQFPAGRCAPSACRR